MKKNVVSSVTIPSIDAVEEERKRLKKKEEYYRALRGTVYALIIVAAVSVLLAMLYIPVLQVSGSSMEPTLMDGDIVVLTKTDNFKVGDLCGFYYQNKLLLKRVIGLPGNYIVIDDDGTVFVDGKELDEPYISEKGLGISDIEYPYQVPDGKIFVLGDHRMSSIDSRSSIISSIEREQVVGKVIFRIKAFNKIWTGSY